MKEKIKKLIFELVYRMYRVGIKKNKLFVYSIEETIDALIDTGKSIVRYGDAEIRIIEGHSTDFQTYDPVLAKRLYDILQFKNENLLVGIPDIFDSLEMYHDKSKDFWKEHLYFSRKTYEKYCDENKKYYNAFLSRMYYIYKDKDLCAKWFTDVKKIWKDKPILLIEGDTAHNGVGNDLFAETKGIRRIVGPHKDAYFCYEKILEVCRKEPKGTLVLVALGNTAKLLAEDLSGEGYQIIDIGNLDMEYEWFLHGAEGKEPIPKHAIIGEEANKNAGYQEYLDQIIARIE